MNPQDIAHYRITSKLGEGGMGEVYRATDTKLGRDVAIKIIPEALAQDTGRMARFAREAKVLASLNHPKIAAIYGVEERALVLELVEGPTLADRIAQGALPIEEALDIARQIADALEYAHEKGIIHRDLKPANVKVTPDGTVKVLDFGLAKAAAEEPSTSSPEVSPTLTIRETQAGVILGTAAYMPPEQARGKSVDKRADIWAFGVVLYEMLTGKRLFGGETVSDTLAAVLTKEPDWDRVATQLRPLLQRCLERDPKRRLRDIGDMKLLLDGAPILVRSRSPWLAWGAAVLLAIALLPGSIRHLREEPASAPAPGRFQIYPPEGLTFSSYMSLSPDGRRLVFPASLAGVTQLWVRSLDSLEPSPLAGTEGVTSGANSTMFWSPDSRFVACLIGRQLRKIDISGGPAQTICEAPGFVRGGSWSRDNKVIFGTDVSGLLQVAASGGAPSALTSVDRSRDETHHGFPFFLPDGKHFIYSRISTGSESAAIYLGSLDVRPEQQDTTKLLVTPHKAEYVPTVDPAVGHLVFLRDGTLVAAPFDATRRKLTGEPAPVAERVATGTGPGGTSQTSFSTSANGVLAYRTALRHHELTWFDRQGKVLSVAGRQGTYNMLSLSPDGTKAATQINQTAEERQPDIWLLEFRREANSRFTTHPSTDSFPVWSPDGSRIAYSSIRAGQFVLYQKRVGGTGEEEVLLQSNETLFPNDWSRDGRFLLYGIAGPRTKPDIWALPLDGDRKPIRIRQTEFFEGQARFSPDARWVAYVSDESGRSEVYVQPFQPLNDTAGGSVISQGGGYQPRWSRDGKELFYFSGNSTLMAVDVSLSPTFKAGIPRPQFQAPILGGGATSNVHRWDVSPDGKRFLVITLPPEAATAPTTVVLNWQAGLKK